MEDSYLQDSARDTFLFSGSFLSLSLSMIDGCGCDEKYMKYIPHYNSCCGKYNDKYHTQCTKGKG